MFDRTHGSEVLDLDLTPGEEFDGTTTVTMLASEHLAIDVHLEGADLGDCAKFVGCERDA